MGNCSLFINGAQVGCTVTVTSIDGVYYIESSVTDYCLDVENTCINNFANVYMFNKASVTASKPTQLCQLWRIEHLDSGEYSIRPLHNLSMGLNVSGSDVNIISIGTTDASAVIPASARWRIRYSYGGYIFSNGSNRNVVLSVAGASTALEAQAVCQARALANDSQIWYLTEETTTSLCPLVYDSTGHIAGTQYVAPGETRAWEDLGLTVVNYALDLSSPTITYSMSSAGHATLNLSDRSITGVSPGRSPLTLTWHIYGSSYYSQVPVEVLLVAEGTYYIKNKQSGRYIDIESQDMSNNTVIHQWDMIEDRSQRWIFNHQGNGYYSIRSDNSPSIYYMGISNDSSSEGAPIVLRTGNLSSGTLWKVSMSESGGYIFTSLSGESSNYVLSVKSYLINNNGIVLQQNTYSNNTNYLDEWYMLRMLPTNGDEIPYSPEDWTGAVETSCNCYGYALNNQILPNGNLWLKQQMGELSYWLEYGQLPASSSFTLTEESIYAAVCNDFQFYSTPLLIQRIDGYATPPVGTYKIALVVTGSSSSGADYHWYRQDSDGLWSHKRGFSPITRLDASGELIIDPRLADRDYSYETYADESRGNIYSEFLGFYAITPWNGMYVTNANYTYEYKNSTEYNKNTPVDSSPSTSVELTLSAFLPPPNYTHLVKKLNWEDSL